MQQARTAAKAQVCPTGAGTCQTKPFLLLHVLEDLSTCHVSHLSSICLRFSHRTLSALEETCKEENKVVFISCSHTAAAAASVFAGSAATRSTLDPVGYF